MQGLLNDFHITIANAWIVGVLNASVVIGAYFCLFVFGRKTLAKALTSAFHIFQSGIEENLVQAFFKILRRLGILIGLSLIVEGLPLPARLDLWITNSLFVVTAFMVVAGLFDLTQVFAKVLETKAHEFEQLITKVIKILTVTIAVMIVMRHFNYDIWHILTALGIGTLAVGLAAQPTLSNMIAGFTILIDRPFRPGDRVLLTGGDSGDVVHIGMRSTQIQTADGNMLVVSNSELVNSRVVNFSMPNDNLGHKVKFYFAHEADLPTLKILIGESVKTVPGVIKESVNVLATNVNEWSMEVCALFKVEHFAQTPIITDRVIDAVISELKRRQIKFASPRPEQVQYKPEVRS